MNNIVIVEDRLGRGVSLAGQFMELAGKYPELGINVLAVCYFGMEKGKAENEIKMCGRQPFEVRRISLWNFAEVMDRYLDSGAHIVMDYMLEGDCSGGIPGKRVNIRYARGVDEDKKKRLWFYTGTGRENKRILCELVGREQVLDVLEVGNKYLRLDLEVKEFTDALKESGTD